MIANETNFGPGGNGDPNSGSAVLVEFTKAINKLREAGWQPKRNIVLASWDAEEWGLIGSVEWVEEHVDWLTETAVAYLNIGKISFSEAMHSAFRGSGQLY